MDQAIDNVFIRHEDLNRAIDQAVWMNFKVRKHGLTPFSVIERSNEYAVVSDDILEFLDGPVTHSLYGDYVDLDYDHIKWLSEDPDLFDHWSALRGAFSTMDGELLRFILHMKIPLEKFIRYELAARGHDKNHEWCGVESAKEIWLTEE